ncbi:MAG: NHL repeat-containing protein [Opitutales bacterium]
MNTTIHKFALFFTTCLLACSIGHAYEQDNWYLAWEKSISYSYGVAYYEDNSTGIRQIYQLNGSSSSGKISVYDLNGSLDRHITIASSRRYTFDLCLDAEGNIYIAEYAAVTCLANDGTFKWRKGKNASMSGYGSTGSGNGEFSFANGITQGPDGNLYVTDRDNHRVQVLDKNGTFIKKFGENGSAPGQLNGPGDLIFLPDGRLIVGDNSYLNYFDSNGTFITRTNSSSAKQYVSLAPDGSIWSYQRLRDSEGSQIVYQSTVNQNSRTAFTPEGDLIESGNNKLRLWKRAYRTKGLVNRNVIPQPAIRGVTQRAGTNVLDLDFEIVDPDDSNATIGIIAYAGSDKLVPQTWVDGTANKIGTPITTNQVHRVSWDVKQDWTTNTGTIKFEILCQDGRTNKPVDLHFLTLPFSDGNMTISRSPLKDSDFLNYAKFLLSTGQAQFESNTSNAVFLPPDSNTTSTFTFTNCGAAGSNGPSAAQILAEYNGTNLQGQVTSGWKAGYQKWTVPTTGTYTIEAIGARGGIQPKYTTSPGRGAYIRGEFNLTAGQELTIVVGQPGQDNPTADGGTGGGGATFVVADTNNTPLVIAGGGSGQGGDTTGQNASITENGLDGYGGSGPKTGGSAGSGGLGQWGGGGGGFDSNGTGLNTKNFGGSFQEGAQGGLYGGSGREGGFGGGGAAPGGN